MVYSLSLITDYWQIRFQVFWQAIWLPEWSLLLPIWLFDFNFASTRQLLLMFWHFILSFPTSHYIPHAIIECRVMILKNINPASRHGVSQMKTAWFVRWCHSLPTCQGPTLDLKWPYSQERRPHSPVLLDVLSFPPKICYSRFNFHLYPHVD